MKVAIMSRDYNIVTLKPPNYPLVKRRKNIINRLNLYGSEQHGQYAFSMVLKDKRNLKKTRKNEKALTALHLFYLEIVRYK